MPDITEFDSGAIRDDQSGKPAPIETSSPIADWRYVQYMTPKQAKYGTGNFKKGILKWSYLESAARHFLKLRALEDCKKFGLPVMEWMEPEEDHAAAIRFNIDGFMHEDLIERWKLAKYTEQQIDRGLGYRIDETVYPHGVRPGTLS